MNYVFMNEAGRLRSGWRFTFFLVAFLFLSSSAILLSVAAIRRFSPDSASGGILLLLIPFSASAAIAILLGVLFGRVFDGVPARVLGLLPQGTWVRSLALGLAFGSVAITTALLIAWMGGSLSLTFNRESSGKAIASTLAITLLIFIVGAVSEEALFRGYLLQTLVRSELAPVGIGVTSALFALAHNDNPAASALSLANTFIAGIWFAVGYMRTRDLWFPIGLHLSWNWLQGPVFGINVSGIAELTPDPVMRVADIGPAWLSGGGYGIEGGVACTIALAIAIILLYFSPFPGVNQAAVAEPSPGPGKATQPGS